MTAGSSDANGDVLFNVAIATIFAREFLEGAIIIGNYRTVINKNEDWDEETKKGALKNVTYSASIASAVAIVVVLALAIPLGVLSKELNEKTIEIIEGVSKVVASICILQLSVKIPVWLKIYWKVSIFPWKNKEIKRPDQEMLTLGEIRFNVAWNIWREVAECGVFLIPFFLGTGAKAIPLSALVGIAVALVLGLGMYVANHRMKSKGRLAFFMSGLTLFLAIGLFVGGCHEFEEVWGETKKVWTIDNPNMSHKEFPMVIFKPFGYSSSRTVLQITTFWCFLALGLGYHYLKYRATKDMQVRYYVEYPKEDPANASEDPVKDVEAAEGAIIDKTETSKPVQSDESSEEETPKANEEETNEEIQEA
jgi:high-affinity iron transporter